MEAVLGIFPGGDGATLHGMCDAIGLLVASMLNVMVSVLEAVTNFLVQLLDAFGFTNVICSASADPFQIIAPLIEAVALILNAVGELLDYISPSLGDLLRFFVNLLEYFLEPTSFLHKLFMLIWDVFVAFIELLAAMFGSGSFVTAISNFIMAVLNLLYFVLEMILALFDCVIFSCHPYLECFIHPKVIVCLASAGSETTTFGRDGPVLVGDDVNATAPAGPYSVSIAHMAESFSPTEPWVGWCHGTLSDIADKQRMFEDAEMSEENDTLSLDWWTRSQAVLCVSTHAYRKAKANLSSSASGESSSSEPMEDGNGLKCEGVACTMPQTIARGADFIAQGLRNTKKASFKTPHEVDASAHQTDVIAHMLSRISKWGGEYWKSQRKERDAADDAAAARKKSDTARKRDEQIAAVADAMSKAAAKAAKAATDTMAERRGGRPPPPPMPRLVTSAEERWHYLDPATAPKDTCGHTINASFWSIWPVTPCPTECPWPDSCYTTLEVPPICPIGSCPSVVAAFPEAQAICARVCTTALQTTAFSFLCVSTYPYVSMGDNIGTDHSLHTFFSVFITDVINNYVGTLNLTLLTAAELTEILDPDGPLAPLNPSDTCTDIGRYGYPRAEFCANQCDSGNPSSLVNRVIDNATNMSKSGVLLLNDVCNNFCVVADPDCALPATYLPCGSDYLADATCYTRCPIAWSGPVVPLGSYTDSVTACYPTTMSCDYAEPDPDLTYACSCPVAFNADEHYCHCQYDQEPVKVDMSGVSDGSRVGFICPWVAETSLYHWYTTFDEAGLTAALQPQIPSTRIYSAPVNWRKPYFIDPVTGDLYLDAFDWSNISWFNASWSWNGTTYPPFNGYMSEVIGLTGPPTVENVCHNTTANVTENVCADDFVCTYTSSCANVTENVCIDFTLTEHYYVTYYTSTALGVSVPLTWQYPILQFVPSTSRCFTSASGLCDYRHCSANATYTHPWPVGTCIPESHCATGQWCQSPGCYAVGNGTWTIPYTFVYEYDHIRTDDPLPQRTVPYHICANVTRKVCHGPHLTNAETWFTKPGGCNSTENQLTYEGIVDGLPQYAFSYPIACRYGPSGCAYELVQCLNVTTTTTVRLHDRIRGCMFILGCSLSSSCASCDANPAYWECNDDLVPDDFGRCQSMDGYAVVNVVASDHTHHTTTLTTADTYDNYHNCHNAMYFPTPW